MPIDYNAIEELLRQVEGPCQSRGYIPCRPWAYPARGLNYIGRETGDPRGVPAYISGKWRGLVAMGASGVTIATGCDLGQTDLPTLKEYGLPCAITDHFIHYLGKKRDRALQALYEEPLYITPEQAAEVDAAAHRGYLKKYVIPAYGRDSMFVFNDLPGPAQAVIMSVCFQKGCGGVARDWPRLWGYLTSGQWQKAHDELETGFTQYTNRRKQEAQYLRKIL